jgi:hypothetical protein
MQMGVLQFEEDGLYLSYFTRDSYCFACLQDAQRTIISERNLAY